MLSIKPVHVDCCLVPLQGFNAEVKLHPGLQQFPEELPEVVPEEVLEQAPLVYDIRPAVIAAQLLEYVFPSQPQTSPIKGSQPINVDVQ